MGTTLPLAEKLACQWMCIDFWLPHYLQKLLKLNDSEAGLSHIVSAVRYSMITS